MHHQIVQDVKEGAYYQDAVMAAGISKQTLYNWLEWGKDGREPYKAFFDSIEKASAIAKMVASKRLMSGIKEWKSQLEWLRARSWRDWGREQVVKNEGEDEGGGSGKVEVTFIDESKS